MQYLAVTIWKESTLKNQQRMTKNELKHGIVTIESPAFASVYVVVLVGTGASSSAAAFDVAVVAACVLSLPPCDFARWSTVVVLPTFAAVGSFAAVLKTPSPSCVVLLSPSVFGLARLPIAVQGYSFTNINLLPFKRCN